MSEQEYKQAIKTLSELQTVVDECHADNCTDKLFEIVNSEGYKVIANLNDDAKEIISNTRWSLYFLVQRERPGNVSGYGDVVGFDYDLSLSEKAMDEYFKKAAQARREYYTGISSKISNLRNAVYNEYYVYEIE